MLLRSAAFAKQPDSKLAADLASCQSLARWPVLQVSEPDSNLAASLLRSRSLGAHSATLRASALTGTRRAVRAASSMVQTQTTSLRPVVKVCQVTGVLAATGLLAARPVPRAAWRSAQASQASPVAGAGSRCWLASVSQLRHLQPTCLQTCCKCCSVEGRACIQWQPLLDKPPAALFCLPMHAC